MKSPRRAIVPVFAILAAGAVVASPAMPARAAEDAPTALDVEQARRCAAEARAASRAFGEVRDSLKAGGATRADALLTDAEDALMNARSACRNDEDVSAQLELLAGEAASLRRTLPATQR